MKMMMIEERWFLCYSTKRISKSIMIFAN